MNDAVIYGLILLLVIAISGLGVKFSASFRSGNKTTIKNVSAGGDVVGRDKVSK